MKLTERIYQCRTYFDGGMGTLLQKAGLSSGELPENWNLTHPDVLRDIHLAYMNAGANIITSNTFGANSAKYHGDAPLADVIAAGISIARGGDLHVLGPARLDDPAALIGQRAIPDDAVLHDELGIDYGFHPKLSFNAVLRRKKAVP